MRHPLVMLAFSLLLGLGLLPGAASAHTPAQPQQVTLAGDTSGGTTWRRPVQGTQTLSGVGTAVRYETALICPTATGTYEIETVTDTWDGYLFVYRTTFDPNDQFTNLLASNDDHGGVRASNVLLTMEGGVPHVVVQTGFGNGDFGPWSGGVHGDAPVQAGACPSTPPPPPSPTQTCQGLTPTIIGTDGDDVLVGTGGDDVIMGLGGNDSIQGRGGDDVICGGPGVDLIKGQAGNDTLRGQGGDDDLQGGGGDDRIIGEDGDDAMFGGAGTDSCTGNSGTDTVDGCESFDGIP